MRDATKVYSKYINEALSKDYTHAMTRFDSIVKDFKACKSADGTSLSLVADMLRFLGKFVEEHALDKSMAELKSAKEQIRKAMDNLDIAADKLRKGDVKDKELGIKDMAPIDGGLDDTADDVSLDGDTKDDSGLGDTADDTGLGTDDKGTDDTGDFGSESDVPPKGGLDSEPMKPAMKGSVGGLGGDSDFEPLPTR